MKSISTTSGLFLLVIAHLTCLDNQTFVVGAEEETTEIPINNVTSFSDVPPPQVSFSLVLFLIFEINFLINKPSNMYNQIN